MLIKCQVSTPVGQDYWKCCGALGGCWRIDTLLTVSGTKSPPSKIFERIRIDEWARSMTLPMFHVERCASKEICGTCGIRQGAFLRYVKCSMFHVEHCGNISQNERLTSFLSNKMY